MQRKILERVFITKKFTQCKTSRTLKIDLFETPDNKNIGKLFSRYEIFSWTKLILVLIHLKYWYYNFPIPRLSLPPSPSQSNFTQANQNRLQQNPHDVLHWFLYFVLRHLTAHHPKYWMYQTMGETCYPSKIWVF